jgi:PAS domain S-box-containing protein
MAPGQEIRWPLASVGAFVDAAPDAVLAVDHNGIIRAANAQAGELFGSDRDELVGLLVDVLVPEGLRARHAQHRAEYLANPRPRAMGAALDLIGRGRDGTEFPIDVSLSTVDTADGPVVLAFARDASMRKRAGEQASRLRESDEHRVYALEINDNVVQGLAGAMMCLQADDVDGALSYVQGTLATARAWIAELLGETHAPIKPGDLVRREEGGMLTLTDPEGPPIDLVDARVTRPLRVLIADDAADLRFLICTQLAATPDIVVIGEAENGREAIELAESSRPDVVILDLSMPVMDGLEALPVLRAQVPDAAVIVLSGFGGETMRSEALERGAATYLEKGTSSEQLIAAIRRTAHAPAS